MFRTIQRTLAVGLVIAGALAPVAALAAGDVTVALTAKRVTKSQGHEVLASAEQAMPGEVIEYRATYRNHGTNNVSRLEATLPIPAGVEFLPGTALPGPDLASLDGKRFAPVPLLRKQRTSDGRLVTREVPVAEYRWLRWSIGTLAAKQSREVVARVRVTPVLAAAVTR